MAHLVVYLTGHTTLAQQAVALANVLRDRGDDVEIVDVLEEPQRAEDCRVLATPTVVRLEPAPARCVVGITWDLEKMLGALGLETRAAADGLPC